MAPDTGASSEATTRSSELAVTVGYRIDAVPSLVANGASQASALNADGVVAGAAQASSGATRAIRWMPGSNPVDLGTLPGGNTSSATGVNRALSVVGSAAVSTVASHAFVYAGSGPMKDIGHLDFGGLSPTTQNVSAGGINDAGVIAGTSPLQLGAPSFAAYTRAFVWKNGALTDLGSLGGSNSMASAINSKGWVTGSTATPAAAEHAFVWNGGPMMDIGICDGAASSRGRAINEAGDVAGWCFFPQVNGYPNGHPAIRHAFLWTANGGMRDLGTLGNRHGDVLGIGADDTVVGFTVASTGGNVAFIAPAGGAIQNLNDLLPAGSGWTLSEARAINAQGSIAGVGTLNGVTRGFVLTPIR
ncbi:MAG TPA: hypothetical protein VFK05_03190 [Polyangiaceae bacterium]|nr:hypothetical protein [Polyangiaceae bacterium]